MAITAVSKTAFLSSNLSVPADIVCPLEINVKTPNNKCLCH